MQIDQKRPPWQKKRYERKKKDPFYQTEQWRRIRKSFLAIHKFCIKCGQPATVADHKIQRVKGGSDDFSNLQPMCSDCHKIKSAQEGQRAQTEARKQPSGGR